MRIRTLAACLLIASAAAAVQAAPPLVQSVTVQGVLQSGEFLGAPGNGDNPASDRAETAYYLQLPAPLSKQFRAPGLLAPFSPASQSAAFIQLMVFDEEQSVARTLVGKHIRVTGDLVEPESGTQHTPALLRVKSMAAIRDWQW
jgi:hypothetical protein